MKIGDFFVELGVNADTVKVKDLVRSIGELPAAAAAGIAAIAGIELTVQKLVTRGFELATGMQMFESQTGLSSQELQKWQIVAEQANVSAGAVASSLIAVQRNIAEIRMGRGNIAPFQLLNIQMTDALDIMNQLRGRIRNLDQATAVNIISQMGFSPEMIQVLRLSDSEFQKMSRSVHGLTTQNTRDFLDAKRAIVELGMKAEYFGVNFVGNLIHAGEALGKIKGVLPLIGAGVAAIAVAFAPVTAAIAGLLLLVEDVYGYEHGKVSALGYLLGKNPAPGKTSIEEKATQVERGGAAYDDVERWAKSLADKLKGFLKGGDTTIYVTSTADAQALAEAMDRQSKRKTSKAAHQSNRGGY